MRLSELVLDFDLYPRCDVDSVHVGYLCEALQAGTTLPPIIVDADSKRVIDGFHRYRAYLRLYGEDHDVEVLEEKHKTEADLFLAAVRANSAHGRRMSRYDQAHVVVKAANLHIDSEYLAGALHVPVDTVEKLRVDKTAWSGRLHVPVKCTIAHKAGQQLSKRQVEANRRLGGMRQLFYVNQLILLVESDLLDTENEQLMERLEQLARLLDGVVAAGAAGE